MKSMLSTQFQPTHPQPKPLKGFSHINRYWDKQQGVYAAKILPGQFYVSVTGEMIVTVLGSCISACVRDRFKGIGGMNHFMLPVQRENMEAGPLSAFSESARYGNWAMEYLINEVLKNGGEKRNLEIKVFGGGKVLESMNQIDIGRKNIDFVHQFLSNENLNLAAEDVGGLYPRKVLYFSDTGSAKIRKLKTVRNDVVFERERSYARTINAEPAQGDIELFD
ncbi:chemoreceptor glutamine deamidase CheD [Ketobacter sp.]|uniref:chemoreceptor glutamine deamidase CheD n=1 Tax=Ketobacter sp. TaxID=2083498 RepID=UPI0025B945D1|nr:chemoreceptor glutamine deamidase CheD [Ketobacter sp.]